MFRPVLLTAAFAIGAAVAVPALPVAFAEDAAPAGRYLLSSDNNEGFVRLDTRTGAVSHCGQRAGSWFCEPLAEAGSSAELAALTEQVANISAGLDKLSARVDGLAADVAKAKEPPASDGTATEPGLTGRLVDKFLDMVRALKYGGSAES